MRRRSGFGLAAAIAAASLALPVSTASAAPANDHFADAEPLAGLPIGVTRSNFEATGEPGEPIHGPLGDKDHSVWFAWEAPDSGLVTIGTCGSAFETLLAVYTGAAVDALTKVAGDDPSTGGPGCPAFDGKRVTFEASAGVTYRIAVDGDPFYLPLDSPPAGEGTFELQIESTPLPPNDDFAAAATLAGSFDEGGPLGFHWASAQGSNWNATKQAGEPDHGGDPGGASVWYQWTAPRSGEARVHPMCQGLDGLLGVYAGSAVNVLFPVESSDDGSKCRPVNFVASAGTAYRIAVDGSSGGGAGGPSMNDFSLLVTLRYPLPQSPAPDGDSPANDSPPVDRAPNTTIAKRALKRGAGRVRFVFRSSERNSTFRCKLDRRRFLPCKSPKTYRKLRAGRHTFKVVAVDVAGKADLSPAISRFAIPKPRRKRGRR